MRLAAVLFIMLAGYSVLRLLHDPYITPDSVVYMTGAKNLRNGIGYVIRWNYPNQSPVPQTVVISDYPPGYSIVLSAAMRFVPDPMHAAYVVQASAIALLYAALWWLCRALDMRPLTIGLLIVWLTCTAGWQLVTRAIWTETLFAALCVGVLACMLHWQRTRKNVSLYAAWAMLVASVLIKYMGVGNIVPIVLVLWMDKRGE
jgi:4-amino-4-deoxy-L-arabinose transferase-like glycosyltransferase